MSGRGRGRVAVVGVGGLGSPLCEVLARAGVGALTLVDFDRVELANLQRQVLYTTADVGRLKVVVAAERARALRPECRVREVEARLGPGNARELLAGQDVICDGTDSLEAKFLVNDAAVALGVPAVLAGVLRFEGQVMTVLPGRTACYRCLFEAPPDEPPPTCAQAGVLGAMAGLVGAFQAAEVLRLLEGRPPELAGAVLTVDLLGGRHRRVEVPRDVTCAACAGVAA